jgi:hypothetical protein
MEGNRKEILIKILVEVARVILGITFIFSGFVKAVDPMGTVYKIEDYLAAFNLSSLSFLALPGSFFLCGMEFLLGAFMFLGIYRKLNSRLIFLVMCFMTPLTLYLAIANPVDDCGCFGDAWKISNWETFYKNIVLLACSLITLKYHRKISNFFTGKTYWIAALFIVFFVITFMVRNYYLDPLFDFRPYKTGANIPELMSVEEGKGRLEQTSLVYEKDGKEQEFTEENYPWDDPSWTFVRMDTKVIHEGEKPIITDLTMGGLVIDPDKNAIVGEVDITQEILTDTNYVFLMISPTLEKIRENHLSDFEDIANYAHDYGYRFYCLTSSVSDDILAWKNENVVDFNFCRTDERTLKTIIRTNPGLLLMKDGVVINKWADVFVPAESELTASLSQLPLGQVVDNKEKDNKNLFYISAIFILPLLLLKGFDFLVYRKKKKEAKQGSDSSDKGIDDEK